MAVQVDQELCAGCGECVGACSFRAIRLVDHCAVIDGALCNECEACVNACPNGAITVLPAPVRSVAITVPPASEFLPLPARDPAGLPGTAAPTCGLAPLARAALAFLENEVAPRLVDVLVIALERRLARPATTTIAPASTSSRILTAQGRGKRRQARIANGCAANRIHKEK
jgi:Fe-S-cluster-containing hydrogenase component 2